MGGDLYVKRCESHQNVEFEEGIIISGLQSLLEADTMIITKNGKTGTIP